MGSDGRIHSEATHVTPACVSKGIIYLGLYETITALDSRPFLTQTAGELLFDGYDDTLLSMADMFASSADRPMDKFAWFYKVDVWFFHQLSQIILYSH